MGSWIDLRGPERALYLFDTRMVGMNADNGKKLLFTLALIAFLLLLLLVLLVTIKDLNTYKNQILQVLKSIVGIT